MDARAPGVAEEGSGSRGSPLAWVDGGVTVAPIGGAEVVPGGEVGVVAGGAVVTAAPASVVMGAADGCSVVAAGGAVSDPEGGTCAEVFEEGAASAMLKQVYFILEAGVSLKLLELTTLVPHNEIYWMSMDDAISVNLINYR